MKMLVGWDGRKFFFSGKDIHTKNGFIRKEEIEAAREGSILKTNIGHEMFVVEASFVDVFKRIKRSPQIIPLKDIGLIVAETGIGKKSVVLDAGSGSGATACFIANIAKKVYTYEIRDDFYKIVKENIARLELKNVVAKKGDVYKKINEKNIDVIILDLPSPWEAIETCKKSLKIGGFLVSYSPTVPQVADFVSAIKSNSSFIFLRTIEVIERDWEYEGRKIRPKSQQIGHSGFLTFCRKIH
ncbi:MAG: methyltransferase domain-containing protein [Candidatus Woesearchaeota archaeon]